MTRERAPGEGTIDRLPSGRFRLRMRRADGERVSKTFATFDEAERTRDAALAVLIAAEQAPVGPVILGAYAVGCLDEIERESESRDIAGLRSRWRCHFAGSALGRTPLTAVTWDLIEAQFRTIKHTRTKAPSWRWEGEGEAVRFTEHTVSRQSAKHCFHLLRRVLSAAVADRKILLHPMHAKTFKDINVGRWQRATDDWSYVTTAEIALLLSSGDLTSAERILLTVAIYTGLRPGELFTLRWADVRDDDQQPSLTVRYSWGDHPPKNGRTRDVPLLAPARDALRLWRESCPKTVEGLVFPSKTGCRRPRGDDGGWGDQVMRKKDPKAPGMKTRAGITRELSFYNVCRDTCASHLLMGSWGPSFTLPEVGAWLGHADAKVTERYARIAPERLHAKAALTARRDPPTKKPLGHASQEAPPNSPVESKARDERFEPSTFGFGGQGEGEKARALRRPHDPSVTHGPLEGPYSHAERQRWSETALWAWADAALLVESEEPS